MAFQGIFVPYGRYPSSRHLAMTTILLCVLLWLIISLDLTVPSLQAQSPKKERQNTKLALLIEDRPLAHLVPVLIHFMALLAPSWDFLFLGSASSIRTVYHSAAARQHISRGWLRVMHIPDSARVDSSEHLSRFLTSSLLYERLTYPAEQILVFQTDSMLCANARLEVDDFTQYDWVGAPWDPNAAWGGNGGLSVRNRSRIQEILRHESRAPDSEPEDVWLSRRLSEQANAVLANATVGLTFAGETFAGEPEPLVDDALPSDNDDGVREGWRGGFYEPLGYHVGGSGAWLHGSIWGTKQLRDHIWDYCPEVKMLLSMDVAQYVPGTCWSSFVD